MNTNVATGSERVKISASLKNGHVFDAAGNLSPSGNIELNWQQQCTDVTNMSCGDSQAC